MSEHEWRGTIQPATDSTPEITMLFRDEESARELIGRKLFVEQYGERRNYMIEDVVPLDYDQWSLTLRSLDVHTNGYTDGDVGDGWWYY